ncbi:MAG: hypothetical protein A2Y57_03690 [Candidatus Woykebacteria bacterium RBG_13_40_7b]|uniref:Uncharacterized protein n=1 Tax=Candidatus Woykebacteria bacterium RBG_13_40_7b TaxID=1802594 RepID=A0A1G1W6K6_9BACT|nr:MAG: hypothetical protein A2Y57_03690 [Candidatus Woykebacteria bacterium RBG_13_40_7b]
MECGDRGLLDITAKAYDEAGKTESSTITIEIVESSAGLMSFSVTPDVIESGSSAELSWKGAGFNKTIINPDIGEVGANGKIRVSPKFNTTYAASFFCNDGSLIIKKLT